MYPDGEVLAYDYNKGGQMRAVHGQKGSYVYHYVQRLDHDKFEQRTYLLFGNNTESRYAYDPFNRRLAHLSAGKGAGNLFMDLSYSYDQVGNITALANAAPVASPNQMGGVTSYTYQYDDLYRLTGSTGTFDTQPDKQHAYTLSMQYDAIHNITQKTQLHTLRQPSGQKLTQQKTSYDWTYKYDGAQPHAPTHLGQRTFSYDANGNQLGWTHDKNGTRRTITWDEENRIQKITDNGHQFFYTYDGSGQRMTKRGPQGETGYINQWMTLRNGEVGTKHVFAGTTRVVSKLVKQDKPNSKRKGRIVYEKDQYYYHPDHLGTTAYITHTNGQVYQHLEYFPFGETWVEEHSNKQRTPYQFTAKELDEETNLYYFGARYYDPRTSVWQSVDPILGEYFGSDESKLINKGVFESRNLGLFTYSFNSPVVMYDPDGNFTVIAQRHRDGITGQESWSFQFESDGVQQGVIDSAMAKTTKLGKKADRTRTAAGFLVGKPVGYKHDGLVDRIGKFFREDDVDAEIFSGKEELLGGLIPEDEAKEFIKNLPSDVKEEWGYGDILDRAKEASEDAPLGTSGGLIDKFLDDKQSQWESNPDAM